MNKKFTTILFAVIVYIASAALSYLIFSKSSIAQTTKNSSETPAVIEEVSGDRLTFDASSPKTEGCPLNGAMYSKEQKNWWEKHRPLGVMIENHQESRPQSGLAFADVVYEAVAEGGITRFLAVYYCQDAGQLGPVRSARTYYLDFISEYGNYPLYAHVGGANAPGPADALSQINEYGWGSYNDLNQFSIGFPTFWRDYDRLGRTVATEHTMYSTTSKLWDFAAKDRKLTNVDEDGVSWDEKYVPYSFKEDGGTLGESAKSIHLEFWEGMPDYFLTWKYDSKTNSYLLESGDAPHFDKNTDKQISAKNVVVLVMNQQNANDGYENNVHLLYDNIGSGKAYVYMDGKKITGTWKKSSRTARTLLFDGNGQAIKFNKGLIWFEVLPDSGIITDK